MLKACSKCGKVHSYNFVCKASRIKRQTDDTDKLRSKYSWTLKSLEIREKANYLCEYCRKNNVYTYKDLEVHHIEKLRDNPLFLLDDRNLVCLCHTCHVLADAGKISAEELKALARARDGHV